MVRGPDSNTMSECHREAVAEWWAESSFFDELLHGIVDECDREPPEEMRGLLATKKIATTDWTRRLVEESRREVHPNEGEYGAVPNKWRKIHEVLRRWHEGIERDGPKGISAPEVCSMLDELIHLLIMKGREGFRGDGSIKDLSGLGAIRVIPNSIPYWVKTADAFGGRLYVDPKNRIYDLGLKLLKDAGLLSTSGKDFEDFGNEKTGDYCEAMLGLAFTKLPKDLKLCNPREKV